MTLRIMGDEDVTALLSELHRVGARVRVEGDDLRVTAPSGALTADLRGHLRARKADLVDMLRSSEPATPPVIVPDVASRDVPFAPSDLQMAFLIGDQEGLDYRVRPHQYLELELPGLDATRYERALNEVLERHRHDLVVVRDDLRLQAVAGFAPVRVTVHDFTTATSAEAELGVLSVRAGMTSSELPLDHWPWFQAAVSLMPDGRHRLHINNNNFFSDGPGTAALLERVLRRYHDPAAELPPMAICYRDAVTALNEIEQSALGRRSRDYWLSRIADWPGSPQLPTRSGPPAGRSELVRREWVLEAASWARLTASARQWGLTPTNALYAVFAEVVATWSGSRHFLLNHMMTHRQPLHPQMWEVVGNFASLYPLEVDWRHDEPFGARARRLQAQVMSDVDHTHWSGVKVLQALNQARRSPGRAACPVVVGSGLFMGRTDRPVHSHLETPQTILDYQFWEQSDESLWVVWDVLDRVFEPDVVDVMHVAYRDLVTLLSDVPDAWHRTGFELAASERHDRRPLVAPPSVRDGELLHEALASTEADSGASLLVHAGVPHSRATVRGAARTVSRALHRAGVRPRDLVSVEIGKCPEQVAAVLGVLGAGAAYVPVDPQWPADRRDRILRDAGIRARLVAPDGQQLAGTYPGAPDVPVLTVSDVTTEVLNDDAARDLPVDPPAPGTTAADTAYVIFTSGSTGRPKGAELDHRGPMNTIRDVNTRYAVGSADVILGVSALTFDLSVWDLFGSLHSGATLVLPTSDEMHPQAWLDLCRRHRVTVWSSVPALMDLLTEQAERTGANLPDLRLVLLSGDWIPLGLPDRIRSVAPHARIVSLGGATEASIWSIWHEIETVDPAWSSIPYGVPMAGQPWFVLSPDLRECPDRVAGDLYIGGVGLAKGYRNDPERTAAAFVRHPVTGERLYRTGDRGRWTPDGHIELLGRTDFQVKIQGFRVELGDVEHHLSAHPRVTACLVGAAPAGSGVQLQAIVVQDGAGPPVAETTLRDHLRERLPRYMVPSVIRTVERLPLTPNGKVDRCAVRVVADPPVQTDRSARSAAATTPLERTVAQIWADVLERSEPGIDDDFFDLGGQSFAGLRVLARIATDCGSRLPLGALLETPTIRGLCARIESGRAKQTESLVPLVVDRPGEPWFVVHPAGGEVLAYRELAALLDRPVHGFAAAPGGPQETTVTELADAYVSDLDLVQPGGPVHLLGWSSGAVIALEMTRLLHDQGRDVRHLVLIDAPAPLRAAASGPDEATLLRWFRADLDGTGPKLTAGWEQPPPALEPTWRTFGRVVSACHRYAASPVPVAATLFRATRGRVSEFADTRPQDRADWGWADLVGHLDVHEIDATHHTLLAHPAVDSIATVLRHIAPHPAAEGDQP